MHSGYAKAAKVLAAITLVSLIAHSKLLLALVSLLTNDGNIMTIFLGSAGLLYPVLAILSVAGLWTLRVWGFYAFYLHLVIGTLLLGVSFLPVLPALLPPELRIWVVIAINMLALIAAVVMHRGTSKKRP